MLELRLNGQDFCILIRDLLLSGQKVRFKADGSSMCPFILPGDTLEAIPMTGNEIRRGEVLLVEAGDNRLIAHRVILTRKQGEETLFMTRGDACSTSDGWFHLDQIMGRVIAIEHNSRRINLLAANQQVRVWLWNILVRFSPVSHRLPAWLNTSIKHILLQN